MALIKRQIRTSLVHEVLKTEWKQNKLQDKEGKPKKLKLAGWHVEQSWSWRTSVALRQPYTDQVQGCTDSL